MFLSFSLFHKKEAVREYTVKLFNQLRAYPVSPTMYINQYVTTENKFR